MIFAQRRANDLFANLGEYINYRLTTSIGKRYIGLGFLVAPPIVGIDKALDGNLDDRIVTIVSGICLSSVFARAATLLLLPLCRMSLLWLSLHGRFLSWGWARTFGRGSLADRLWLWL